MPDFKSLLATAALPEDSLQVCLRGDLAARHSELDRTLQAALRSQGPATLGDAADTATLAEELQTIEAAMRDASVTIRVRALPRADWQALVAKHPPREGHEGDQSQGCDFPGLMAAAIPLCIVDPVIDQETWDRFNDVLSAGDYDRLLAAVWQINRGGTSVPKSRLASLMIRANSDDGESPGPTG
jgi:hypothetical protein